MAIEDFYGPLHYYACVETKNDKGNVIKSYPVATAFQGVINQASNQERAMAGQLGKQIDYKMYYPASVPIPDRVIIYDGTRKYRMVGEPKDTMNQGHHYRVGLQRITAETINLGA